MPDKDQSDERSLQFSAIHDWLSAVYLDSVVTVALGSRAHVSADTANAFNSAIQKARLRVTGYRDPLRAPHTLLREPVSQSISSQGELAGAVLRVWAESQHALHSRIVEYVNAEGLEAKYPLHDTLQFVGLWPVEEWQLHRGNFMARHGDDGFAEDDAGLMLCYVTGKVPGTPSPGGPQGSTASQRKAFDRFLEFLKAIPPAAPEWRDAVPDFVEAIAALAASKEAELTWVRDFDEKLELVRNEFTELMSFFEGDTDNWSASRVSTLTDIAGTLGLVELLRSLLLEYQPLHERANNISEERERARRREELQPQILETISHIGEFMTEHSVDSPNSLVVPGLFDYEEETDTDVHSAGALSHLQQEPLPANSLQEALTAGESTSREMAGVSPAEYAVLESENIGLRDNAKSLEAENQDLREEVEALRTELFSSQEREDSWRLAYRSAMDGSLEIEEEETLEVESVASAVEIAKHRFRQELVFAPNSESGIEGNPFVDPSRVWEAFRWLGTTYYASKMGRLRVTDFDQSIKEACGWWYKGDQGETTLSRYEKSYTTRLDGKRYWLAEHIGKGTSFDARYTIRIAFSWDRDRRQVIVGYIGRHQQTDAS